MLSWFGSKRAGHKKLTWQITESKMLLCLIARVNTEKICELKDFIDVVSAVHGWREKKVIKTSGMQSNGAVRDYWGHFFFQQLQGNQYNFEQSACDGKCPH